MIEIDGSYGEGGGQVLRTSLSLAAILREPVRIRNTRAGRKNPGLQPQHLTGARAVAAICGGRLSGDSIGSQQLTLEPGEVKSGSYTFDVSQIKASAGSITLILQTVLLPLTLSGGGRVTLKGGTHVPWSPPVNYIDEVYLPTLARMGLISYFHVEKAGYYPVGGGLAHIDIRRTDRLSPLDLTERGAVESVTVYSAVSNLPREIAERQLQQGSSRLRGMGIEPIEIVEDYPSVGKGTVFFLLAKTAAARAGFTGLGARGKRAEMVADEAINQFSAWLASGAALDKHLADQMILPMVLAEGISSFTTEEVTRHLITNIWVVRQFLPVNIELDGEEGKPGRVQIGIQGNLSER